MSFAIPPIAREVLDAYIAALHAELPHCVEGIYLHGSIALDAYVQHASDIDFLTVVNRSMTELDIQKLAKIHQHVSARFPKPVMDGMYMRYSDLGKPESESEPMPYCNDHVLHAAGYPHRNPVTWWILKRHGITILGPDVTTLPIVADRKQLLEYVFNNMNTYWVNRIEGFERQKQALLEVAPDLLEWEIEWSVLGLLRQFYTLKEHDIISKTAAGEYALHHLPVQWHRPVMEALRIRKKQSESYYASNEQRIPDVIAFLRSIITYCRTHYGSERSVP